MDRRKNQRTEEEVELTSPCVLPVLHMFTIVTVLCPSVMISGGRGTSHGCTRRAGNSVRSADQFLSIEVAKRLAKLSGIGVFHHHGVVVVRRWNNVIRILLLQILLLPPSSVPIPQERTKGAQLLRGTFGTN